jgi:hypothetical protein
MLSSRTVTPKRFRLRGPFLVRSGQDRSRMENVTWKIRRAALQLGGVYICCLSKLSTSFFLNFYFKAELKSDHELGCNV